MQWKNSSDRFGIVAQGFHWLIVLLIIVQYQMGSLAEDLPQGLDKLIMMSRHKSLGISILLLAVLRIAWRLANPPPAPPGQLKPAIRMAGAATHFALYGLLLALPLSGWLASSAANSPVSWWGLVTLPDFIAPGEARFALIGELHEVLTRVLLVIAVMHALAALVHHFIFKDAVLRRMLPGWPGLPRK